MWLSFGSGRPHPNIGPIWRCFAYTNISKIVANNSKINKPSLFSLPRRPSPTERPHLSLACNDNSSCAVPSPRSPAWPSHPIFFPTSSSCCTVGYPGWPHRHAHPFDILNLYPGWAAMLDRLVGCLALQN